jgi:hypothetical protein
MAPTLPRNVKLAQVRRSVTLLPADDWRRLEEDGRAAVDALSLHIWLRARQEEHPAFEAEGEDCVFLTVGWMQGLLQAVGARKTGEEAARAAIASLEERGAIIDTGRTKKPRRAADRIARAEKFQKQGPVTQEGGKEAQPSRLRSFWWRVFLVPALAKVRAAIPRGAYGRLEDVPQHLASLSAFLRRQGLIPRPWRRSQPNPGSVQWVFANSGPP